MFWGWITFGIVFFLSSTFSLISHDKYLYSSPKGIRGVLRLTQETQNPHRMFQATDIPISQCVLWLTHDIPPKTYKTVHVAWPVTKTTLACSRAYLVWTKDDPSYDIDLEKHPETLGRNSSFSARTLAGNQNLLKTTGLNPQKGHYDLFLLEQNPSGELLKEKLYEKKERPTPSKVSWIVRKWMMTRIVDSMAGQKLFLFVHITDESMVSFDSSLWYVKS